jgi:hypothetical protein
MKKLLAVAAALLLIISFVNPENASAQKKWTIMVYCCADNNLHWAGINDLNELELSGSSEDINIIFLLDLWDIDDTHLYYVVHDTDGVAHGDDNNTISPIIDDSAPWLASEEDMGNPQTLQDFLLWSVQNYPAEHYLLSIWDHGSGIFKDDGNFITKGECWDDHGGLPGDYIDLKELKNVMSACYNTLGRKIDIIGHDVCLSGQFETHYQVRDYADISIASADNEPFDGWDYEGPFINLRANPDMTPEELAYQIVEYYYNWYGPFPGCCNTQAAVDLRLMQSTFIPAFHDFNEILIDHMNDYKSMIVLHKASAAMYQNPNIDLWNFAENLAADPQLHQEIRDAANTLVEALDTTVIHQRTANYTIGYGNTIWFPNDYSGHPDVDDYQSKIDFNQTNWPRFLRAFAGELLVQTLDLADGYIDSFYYQKFTAINGTPPYIWEHVGGQLPYGLSFTYDDSAYLSGTPTYATTYGFSLNVTDSSEPPKETVQAFNLTVHQHPYLTGDANYDGEINVGDVVHLINYIFLNGAPPDPYELGDVDCDSVVRLVDVIYLVNYIFREGPPPCQSF